MLAERKEDAQIRRPERQRRDPGVRTYHADERRDEQPAVLEHGVRRVPEHVLDVVIETVRTCVERFVNQRGWN